MEPQLENFPSQAELGNSPHGENRPANDIASECLEIAKKIRILHAQLINKLRTINLTEKRPDYINYEPSATDNEGAELYLAFIDGRLVAWRVFGEVEEGYELDVGGLGLDYLILLTYDLPQFLEKVRKDGATIKVEVEK
jgi:hypothetical protein